MKLLICFMLFVTFVASENSLDDVNENTANTQIENKKHDKRGIYGTGVGYANGYDNNGGLYGGHSGLGGAYSSAYVSPLATSRYSNYGGYNSGLNGYNTGGLGRYSSVGFGNLGGIAGGYSGTGYPYNSGYNGYSGAGYNNLGGYDDYSNAGYGGYSNYNYPYSRSGVVSYSHSTPYVGGGGGVGYTQPGGYYY